MKIDCVGGYNLIPPPFITSVCRYDHSHDWMSVISGENVTQYSRRGVVEVSARKMKKYGNLVQHVHYTACRLCYDFNGKKKFISYTTSFPFTADNIKHILKGKVFRRFVSKVEQIIFLYCLNSTSFHFGFKVIFTLISHEN